MLMVCTQCYWQTLLSWCDPHKNPIKPEEQKIKKLCAHILASWNELILLFFKISGCVCGSSKTVGVFRFLGFPFQTGSYLCKMTLGSTGGAAVVNGQFSEKMIHSELRIN